MDVELFFSSNIFVNAFFKFEISCMLVSASLYQDIIGAEGTWLYVFIAGFKICLYLF